MAHPEYIRKKAIQLRVEKKLTIDEIAERLSVSRTTAFYWVGRIKIPETAKQSEKRRKASLANSERARLKRERAYQQGVDEFDDLAKDETFRDFVCMYLGEGSKRCRNTVCIANSDPTVIALGSRWIRRLGKNKIRYSVQYHADQDLHELQEFWSGIVGVLPEDINLQRKSNSNQLTGRTWRSAHGVLSVSMGDTQLRARLEAWMDRIRSEWK
ncbi:MAG: hypothetical protein J0H66_13295 [Solirubrobacterales bacterium]|nr:hypothetical protein [Solirubrobacterales bacterium]OJU93454.1 MAG: hypothetical protein BGO23_12400 [Solirubrobacterales bacterium 67-14]